MTIIYNTDSNPYIREIMQLWLIKRIWIFVLLILACLALAFIVDTGFLFLATILIFLVFPFVVTNVYFKYGLRKEAIAWKSKRKLSIGDEYIVLDYLEPLPAGLDSHIIYPLTSVAGLKIGKIYDIVYVGTNLDDFIVVPTAAFDDEGEDLRNFRDLIYERIQQNSVSLHK